MSVIDRQNVAYLFDRSKKAKMFSEESFLEYLPKSYRNSLSCLEFHLID